MNRLVLALTIVVLAGAVVAGVQRAAEAQDPPPGTTKLEELEYRVRLLEANYAQLARGTLPPPDPNVYRWDQVDPLTRATSVSNSQLGFLMTCTINQGMAGYYDLWCVRPGAPVAAGGAPASGDIDRAAQAPPGAAPGVDGCEHFGRVLAQSYLRHDPSDPYGLGADGDGLACEELP